MRLSLLPIFVALAVHLAEARVCHRPGELSTEKPFDFIVIGGGTAGSVIASRLTENPNFNVLLIEAGPDNEGVQEIAIPARWQSGIPATYNWNFTTTNQTGLNNRAIPYDRGHVLGGSSSLNAMVYSRGSADDYDRWAKVTGDKGWTWNKLFPLIKRHEKWSPPAGGRNVTGQYDPAVHGFNGNTRVSLPWSGPNDYDRRCLEASQTRDEWKFTLDPNSGYPLGLTWIQSTIGNGERSSSAAAYLTTNVRERPNLTILLDTYTTRVLPVNGGKGKLDLRTVEFADNADGSLKTLTATKEVILSGGSFGSPQILLNSGIGDKADLDAVGVKTIHSLPDVGKGLTDHVSGAALWFANLTASSPVDDAVLLQEWENTRTGPLTEAVGHQILWTRMTSEADIFKKYNYTDPSSGKNAAHFEIAPTIIGNFAGAFVVLLTPQSRGSLKIRSNNPFDAPIIDPGLLNNKFDVLALREGARIAKQFFTTPAFQGVMGDTLTPDPDTTPDDVYEAYVRDSAGSISHAVGTAVMSAKNAKNGVVNPDLRVKGVKGLRIADASVMPFITTSTTQAPVYIIAERAVDLIRSAWN